MAEEKIGPCCAASRTAMSELESRAEGFDSSNTGHCSNTEIAISKTPPMCHDGGRKEVIPFQDLVALPGGVFFMGSENPDVFVADGEGPVREVEVRPFLISRTTVTNEQFAWFVEETGYRTEAERFGWSYVFHLFVDPDVFMVSDRIPELPWWIAVHGADWAHPEGPRSNVADRMDHPVVHVSWNDAMAYCKWSGTRLPTEAEWEYAARGGLVQNTYAWGNSLHPDGIHMCNIWQGKFPDVNRPMDGYLGTAPVTEFEPNNYGLYNVCGNVWEWCSDWFSVDYHQRDFKRGRPISNPSGPPTGEGRVMKGGSYLCHRSYCNRYRVAARSQNTPESSTGHMGFRCAKDA